MQEVILVDEKDNSIGKMEKLKAHKEGVLHRAFSIFLINDLGEILLQKRNMSKYHSGGLWTNTCCSHPVPEETLIDSAKTRLFEEMGIHADFEFAFSFVYKVHFINGLTENEFDHVFVGRYNEAPHPDPQEVSEWKYTGLDQIKKDIEANPAHFTEWFKLALPRLEKYLIETNFLYNKS